MEEAEREVGEGGGGEDRGDERRGSGGLPEQGAECADLLQDQLPLQVKLREFPDYVDAIAVTVAAVAISLIRWSQGSSEASTALIAIQRTPACSHYDYR